MRRIGVIVLGALLFLPAPAEAACDLDGAFLADCIQSVQFTLMPGRGIINSLVGMDEEPALAPPIEVLPVPLRRAERPWHRHRIKPHHTNAIYREAGRRHAKPRREAMLHRDRDVRREPKPHRVRTELDQAAPPRQEAAAGAPTVGAEKPQTGLSGEAAEMLRQREDWLNGLAQKHGFDRW